MTEAEAFRLSIEHTQEMVLFYDRRGIIFFANQSAEDLLGYDSGVAGHAVADILPGAFRERDGIFDLNTSLDLDGFSAEAYRENRTCFPVWTRILNQQEELGIVFAMDVSRGVYLERQVEHADQEVLEASKVKTEFVANVTHELRTPVNGILGNTLELKEMETDGAKLRVLSLIERGCTDMNAIINNILDFSKLESGKFTLEKRKFNFREMLDYVRQSHKIKVAEKGLDFVVSCADDIPEYIVGDELRIAQVLNNLISNACKFTSVGRISVEAVNTSRQDNKMELFFLVIDTGIGIAKEDQDKLFQSFSQVDASISRRYGGTGLGLNICKQLVELMDGTIHVDSDVGKGSVFSFHIWVEIPRQSSRRHSNQL
jgi:signal transduction histidine kinase